MQLHQATNVDQIKTAYRKLLIEDAEAAYAGLPNSLMAILSYPDIGLLGDQERDNWYTCYQNKEEIKFMLACFVLCMIDAGEL